MIHAARLLYCYARSVSECEEHEIRIGSRFDRPATLFVPRVRPAVAVQAWVVLHGLTVLGRQHPSLLRFARALCSSGHAVLIPEIEQWTRLRVRTDAVTDAVVDGAEFLAARPGIDPAQVGVIGFSFGATQALVAAADARAGAIRKVVGFGGYCDLERLAEFMITGEHEWRGERHRVLPDPYGRWIVAGNFLTRVPGLEDQSEVADGLLHLATESGRAGLFKPDGFVEPVRLEIRERLRSTARELWDLLVPPAGQLPADRTAARDLARRLSAAAVGVEPKLQPVDSFARLRARPVLAHGFNDRLVPFSETLRLLAALPQHVNPSATVTRLFAHSIGSGSLPPFQYAAEGWRLLRFFRDALQPERG